MLSTTSSTNPRGAVGLILLAVAVIALSAAADGRAGPGTAASEERTATCTFTNPAYAGDCVEQTAIPVDSTARQACTAILKCLNNPRCETTYCRATTIRSGWRLAKAEEATAGGK
jgi:hypothetical protein